MASENIKSINCLYGLWLIIFLLTSCKTIPSIPDEFLEQSQSIPLNGGASVYIFAEVKKARSVIELLPIAELKNRQAVQMMDRTDFAIIAMFPKESGQRFQLAAWGNYPKAGAGLAFSFSRNWRRQRSATGRTFWHSGADRLSIAMEQRQVFAAASLTGAPFDPLTSAPGTEIPRGFNEFRSGSEISADRIISCWITDPDIVLSRMMTGIPIRFPVQELFLNLYSAEESQYEASLRFQFQSATHARGMAAILNLAGNFASGNQLLAVFLANPPVQNGNNLDIKTSYLDNEEILLIFSMFLNN